MDDRILPGRTGIDASRNASDQRDEVSGSEPVVDAAAEAERAAEVDWLVNEDYVRAYNLEELPGAEPVWAEDFVRRRPVRKPLRVGHASESRPA